MTTIDKVKEIQINIRSGNLEHASNLCTDFILTYEEPNHQLLLDEVIRLNAIINGSINNFSDGLG